MSFKHWNLKGLRVLGRIGIKKILKSFTKKIKKAGIFHPATPHKIITIVIISYLFVFQCLRICNNFVCPHSSY